MSILLEALIAAGVVALGVGLWQRRRARLEEKRRNASQGVTDDVVGLVGVLQSESKDEGMWVIRLTDRSGRSRTLDANLEDGEEAKVGDDVLIITNPTEFAPLVVVPYDVPRLGDLPR